MRKKIMVIALCVLAVPVLIVAVWALMSPGRIRTYSEPDSISEKFVIDINGAPNGFFINGKNKNNPVLLLVSSGPGTDDYVFTDKYKDMKLEEDFTIVYWDYRYMGIAYNSKADIDSIDLANLLDDTDKVTECLRIRSISWAFRAEVTLPCVLCKGILRTIMHISEWLSVLRILRRTIR